MAKMHEEARPPTECICRTVYYIAKSNSHLVINKDLVNQQQLNGINLGSILQSCFSATVVIDHIASQMRRQIVDHIMLSGSKLSVSIDEQ